jgi:UrcA family protein
MNTTSNRIAPTQLTIAALTFALMALRSSAALGSPPPQEAVPVGDKRAAVVSVADLDLTTPAGARSARDRIHESARRLCRQLADIHDLGHQPHFVACVDQAMARALQKLHGPDVAAIKAIAPSTR